jgi:hypothetical protein
MDILKANWIREVDVANTTANSQDDVDEDEEAENEDARGNATSGSSTGSDDEATLISPSLNGEQVPAFVQAYPALVSQSGSTSTSTNAVAMPHDHPTSLAWQTSFAGNPTAWVEGDSSGMLLQHMSHQFEGLDSNYAYLNQHTDTYLANPWS